MDEAKLKQILDSQSVPQAEENARKVAVNLAVAEFKAHQKKNEKSSQGSSILSRLMGMNNPDRRNSMEQINKKKFIYGGMATAMAVVLVTGVSMYSLNTGVQSLSMPDQQVAATAAYVEAVQETNEAVVEEAYRPEPAPAKEMAKADASQSLAMADAESVGGAVAPVAPPMEMMATRQAMPEGKMLGGAPMANMAQAYIPDMPIAPGYHEVGRDKFEDFDINPFKSVSAEPVSTFSSDVDTASYSFIRRQINSGVLPQKDAVRTEEIINYFDYNYPLPESKDQPFKPTVAITDSPWSPGKKLMHIGIKGYDIEPAQKPRSNLVFLLDVSGSMEAPDKLPLLKNSMKLLLDTLGADDTVAITVYAGAAGTVLEPTKASEKSKIVAAIDNLNAGGGTAGAQGINLAYQLAEQTFDKDAVNRVILATDGDFNVGISDPDQLKDFVERKREKGIFLSVFGFGQGNYNDHMMQTLAQNGNGIAAYIDSLSEARKVLVEEATSTLFPIAKDVKIQVEFNPAQVAEYRLIGYETRHLNREDFNNDKVDAGDIGAGHAVTAIYEITPVGGAKSVDDLRYSSKTQTPEAENAGSEYAFLKIRYKLPNENTSKLIETAISPNASGGDAVDINWATAVAGFGQILQGGKYTGNYNYDDVIKLASENKGADEFGYRAEFIQLVRLAKSSSAMQPQ